jgi:hypothetical protein
MNLNEALLPPLVGNVDRRSLLQAELHKPHPPLDVGLLLTTLCSCPVHGPQLGHLRGARRGTQLPGHPAQARDLTVFNKGSRCGDALHAC